MSRKHDFDYFQAFVNLIDYSCSASELLQRTLENFTPDTLQSRITEMHTIEHNADLAKHDLMDNLAHAFMTPIEREDIIRLAHEIDDVTDAIEDVVIRLYMFNISALREEVFEFSALISKCCYALRETLKDFHHFKKPEGLYNSIIAINKLEEEGDKLYTSAMRTLYVHTKDPIEVISWTEIFRRLENCCDTCEHAADVVEGVIMKNS